MVKNSSSSSSSQCSDEKTALKKGAWSAEEDRKLINYIKRYKIWNWSEMAKAAGLARSGKSCRLRWVNYLRPDIKHGNFSKEEEETIMKLHETLGNRWSSIAANLPGRTDNEVKNFWHTHLKKRIKPKTSTTCNNTPLPNEFQASLKSSPFVDEASPINLEGLSNIIVESLTQPMSIDNHSPPPPPRPAIIGFSDDRQKSVTNESIVVETCETLEQPQSSCTQQVPTESIGDGNRTQDSQATLFDALMGPSTSEAMWQQDSLWTFYDFYDGTVVNDYYSLDYMDPNF